MTKKANLFQAEGQYIGLLFAVWLDPALANSLAIEGGEPAEHLHITLCYCGDVRELSDVQIGRAINAAAEAGMMWEPLTGQLAGLGRFNASESTGGKDVVYANVDVPRLEELRHYLASMLDYAGCPPLKTHGYTPHVTLAYIDEGADLPVQRINTQPITINSIWVGVGDRRTEIPLTGSPYKAAKPHALGKTVKAAPTPGNALKAVRKSDDELVVANYMILFGDKGSRDLEGLFSDITNPDGSRGQWFTKATKFDSPYTDLGFLYVDWEHGGDALGPSADEPLGYVDWKSARIDEKGVFVQRVLNRHNKYVKYIEELIELGLLGASSEAIREKVVMKANGEIVQWPLRRDTITVAPMDYRQKLPGNTLAAVKALSQRVPALKTIVEQVEPAEPEASPEAGEGKPAVDAERAALLLELELLEL